jgi:hypothetical protein
VNGGLSDSDFASTSIPYLYVGMFARVPNALGQENSHWKQYAINACCCYRAEDPIFLSATISRGSSDGSDVIGITADIPGLTDEISQRIVGFATLFRFGLSGYESNPPELFDELNFATSQVS